MGVPALACWIPGHVGASSSILDCTLPNHTTCMTIPEIQVVHCVFQERHAGHLAPCLAAATVGAAFAAATASGVFAVSAVADSEDPLVFKSPMSFGSVLLALDLLTGKISGSTRAFSILCCAPGTRERLMPLPDLLLFASPEEV